MTDVKIRKKKTVKTDPTNMSLMVNSISQEEVFHFDKTKITDALINDIELNETDASMIADEVIHKLSSLNLKSVDTSFIRSMVNVVLFEKGFNKELTSRRELIISHNDITNIIESANKENGNMSHNPESINLTLAENIIKDYSLKNIFSKEVVKAHLEGKLHIHDLGMLRAYCSGHSIPYILRNGIRNVENIGSTSDPAGSAETLARHLCSVTQFYTSLFAGAIGWEGVNIFFAPLLRNRQKKELKQLAQTLIFDLSQLAGAKGGQTSFTDFNAYITVPEHYREAYAILEHGKFACQKVKTFFSKFSEAPEYIFFDTREEVKNFVEENDSYFILKYKHFEKEAQDFLTAILDVIERGDATGLPFAFPKINLHINEDSFTSYVYDKKKGYKTVNEHGKEIYFLDREAMIERLSQKDNKLVPLREENKVAKDLVMKASQASSKSGCPYFIFDRNAMSISQCCRLKIDFSEDDKKLVKTPEELRFVGVQNVSINLPNCSLQHKSYDAVLKEIEHRMRLSMKAHIQKTKYLEHLVNLENSPLKFYKKGMDGKPYVDFKRGSYLIGVVGLNECVYNLIGKELHEDKESFKKGLSIIIFMNKLTKELSKEFGITVKLEETPAESTASRFALLDLKKYPTAFVKRNEHGEYYTNSVHFAYDSNVDYIDRLIKQGMFHTLVEAGSMIHMWTGDKKPSKEAIYTLVEKTWRTTECTQWVLSPEYTTCYSCKKTTVGLYEECPRCKSENISQVSRITGYYVFLKKYNKGKRAELHDRNHEGYNI